MWAFIFWRKGREEHYSEFEVMDAFLLTFLLGLLVGRIGFIITQFSYFGLDVIKWIDIGNHPGFSWSLGLIGAGLYLYRLADLNKWDTFEILDFWIQAVSLSLSIFYLGLFFDGSAYGAPTDMPWGVVFPGLVEKHHPLQLYLSVFYFALFTYISRVEYRYRTFNWYRGNKNTAQTGFLISVFIIAVSAFHLLMTPLMLSQWQLVGIRLEPLLALASLVFGCGLLYRRSGRTLFARR